MIRGMNRSNIGMYDSQARLDGSEQNVLLKSRDYQSVKRESNKPIEQVVDVER
jgi:hypothetical protein